MTTLLSQLTEAERAQAMARFEVLRPFLEDQVELTAIARQHSLSRRTLRWWVQRYDSEGLAGLVRQRRTDRGQPRRLPPALYQCVEGLALETPPLSIAVIHRQICALAQRHQLRPPSYSLIYIYAIVRQLPTGLTTLAHHGSKAYRQRFDLLHRREAEAPNAIWQADHCLLDILVLHEGQAPAKPWLTVVLDDYSRAMAGYFLTFDAPSALNTSLALRQAIWRKDDPHWHVCGIPQTLYTDGGSDFTSQHLEQVSADLKICLINSTPGQPRGRGRIERFFQTVQEMLLCTLPGYAPPQGAVRGHPQLTLRELEARFRAFVVDVYHARPHSDTKIPPQQCWEAGGFLPQMPDSLELLDLLLLTVAKSRKVRRDGLWFLGRRYMDPTLAAYVGESVILRYDPRDMAEVRVFYHDRFLCRAICQELAGAVVPLRDIIRARNRHRRDLRQILRDRAQVVDSLLPMHRGHPCKTDGSTSAGTEPDEPCQSSPAPTLRLKRYHHE
jgi:putative transposase